MDLKQYFDSVEGVGVFASFDPDGYIDQAVYTKPFVIDDNVVAFVMKQRKSHKNLKNHLKCSYLFLEAGAGCKGVRMHLTMHHEEKNRSLIEHLRQKQPTMFSRDDDSGKFLVFFEVDHLRPLIGDNPKNQDSRT